jgi:arsenate reductase
MPDKKKILFLCTGNSCRSQMAEGWTREIKGEEFEPYSAGIKASGVNPRAARAMSEAGVDISGQRSMTTDELPDVAFDYIVTLCGHAQENCPFFPGGGKRLHRGFDDPPALEDPAASDEENMAAYRRVRDEIRNFVAGMPQTLGQGEQT